MTLLAISLCRPLPASGQATSTIPIKNFIFIVQENHSFDNYFGTFPGANGIPAGTKLADYPGGPLVETPFLGQSSIPHDLKHDWVAVQLAHNHGAMDGFFWAEWPAAENYYGRNITVPKPHNALVQVRSKPTPAAAENSRGRPTPASTASVKGAMNSSPEEQEDGLSPNGFADDEDPDQSVSTERTAASTVIPRPTPPNIKRRPSWVKYTFSYIDNTVIPNYWEYARTYELCDSFFSSLEGPSLPNHLYAVSAQSGGLVYNYPDNGTKGAFNFFFPSVLDLLGNAKVTFKYYVNALSGTEQSLWNPLPGFQAYERKNHVEVLSSISTTPQFYKDLTNGTLPQVCYLTPSAENSEHPPYDSAVGMEYVTGLVNAVMASSYWQNCAIIIVWDDYGGFYDHVPPQKQADQLGYGFRVPAIVISPYSKVGVNHTTYDLTSLLKLVETAFGLSPLTSRDGSSKTMLECFNFSQKPLPPDIITFATKFDFSEL